MNKILFLLCVVLFSFQAKAQPGNEYLNFNSPAFSVQEPHTHPHPNK